MADFVTLPDYLARGLDIVFVGLNPSQYSADAGHYFANPRNRFWTAFNLAGLVEREFTSEEDAALPALGIGLTDVVKRPTPQGFGLKAKDYRQWSPVLKEKILNYRPRVVCFQGMMAYKAYLKYAEGTVGNPEMGLQGPSPANAKFSVSELASWYRQLNEFRSPLGG